MPVALIDVLAGHHLKEGLLLALLKKEKSGEGSLVEVSLVQVAVASLVNQASNWLVAKYLPSRQGSAHPNIAPYGESFVTADGKRVLLAVGSDRQFEDLCLVLKIENGNLRDKFNSNQNRIKNRAELAEMLGNEIEKMNSNEFLKSLHKKKVPAGLIQNVKEVFEMREARELLVENDGIVGVRSFVAKDSGQWEATNLMPPPHFGEHDDEVRRLVAGLAG
jgi:crotonobetainyl-CoA:carnitine CoA-transferase CaiB-like acyl-CoA transferase